MYGHSNGDWRPNSADYDSFAGVYPECWSLVRYTREDCTYFACITLTWHLLSGPTASVIHLVSIGLLASVVNYLTISARLPDCSTIRFCDEHQSAQCIPRSQVLSKGYAPEQGRGTRRIYRTVQLTIRLGW